MKAQEFGEPSTEFCYFGFTQRTFSDATVCFRGTHTATGERVGHKTREGAVKAIANVEKRNVKIKEMIAFLKAEGYLISKVV